MYFFVCEKAGYDWIKVAQPDLFDLTPAIITARNDAQLQQFFSRYVFRLLEPGEARPRAIAPTPLAAPSPRLLEHVRGQLLGRSGDVPALRVVLGFVTYNNDAGDLRLAIEAAEQALRQASLAEGTAIFLVDNGEASHAMLPDGLLRRFDSQGNVGFGAAHNRLMQEAFSGGADLYVAVNPDGLLHPNAVAELVRMSHANGGAALVEALQFPMEHPKPFEADTFDTPWVSGACLAIPRRIHDAIGGFDDAFFMYCEDVDLSWRARAAGFALKTCPTALFLHAVTNRGTNRNTVRMIYESGVILARKWGAPNFEEWLRTEFDAMGLQMPRSTPITVPLEWRPYAEFGHHFSFAKARW